METEHYTTHHRDPETGRSWTEHHTRQIRVTDFDYTLDLTPFIFPMGYICSVDETGKSIPEMIQIYLDDTNKLKSIGMVKMIDFDYHGFKSLVNSELRRQGWRQNLSFAWQKRQHSVRVHSDNCLQTFWNNPCLTCLFCVMPLCIPYCIMKGYQSGHVTILF
jgi:hypothetical protein